MNENALPSGESRQPGVPKPTSAATRFGGFAICHLCASLLVTPCIILCILLVWDVHEWSVVPAVVLVLFLMMGMYFPLGMLTAWIDNWTVPKTDRDRFLAVAQPTAVAWIWVVIVLGCIQLEGEGTGELVLAVALISCGCAAPSSIFVLCSMGLLMPHSHEGMLCALMLTGVLAGILPPLLFAWGSFWQAARAEQKRAKRELNIPKRETPSIGAPSA